MNTPPSPTVDPVDLVLAAIESIGDSNDAAGMKVITAASHGVGQIANYIAARVASLHVLIEADLIAPDHLRSEVEWNAALLRRCERGNEMARVRLIPILDAIGFDHDLDLADRETTTPTTGGTR